MEVDWNPSENLKKKMHRIFLMHEAGMTYPQIAKVFKNHRVSILRLASWYKKNILNKKHEK